jgi:hypothetical protein
MRRGTKLGSLVLITGLLATTGGAGVSTASPNSKACKAAKAALRSATKRHAPPGQIRRLEAKVKAKCR